MLVTDVHEKPPKQDLAEGVWLSSVEEKQQLESQQVATALGGQGQASRSAGRAVSWATQAYAGEFYLDRCDSET